MPEPTTDASGEDHVIIGAELARTAPSSRAPFMGIVVQVRDTAEHAAQVHAAFAAVHTPVPGTELQTHRLEQNGWVRREVHGHRDRYLYEVYETDDTTETVVCDDAELLELGRLIERRLP